MYALLPHPPNYQEPVKAEQKRKKKKKTNPPSSRHRPRTLRRSPLRRPRPHLRRTIRLLPIPPRRSKRILLLPRHRRRTRPDRLLNPFPTPRPLPLRSPRAPPILIHRRRHEAAPLQRLRLLLLPLLPRPEPHAPRRPRPQRMAPLKLPPRGRAPQPGARPCRHETRH